jgi:aspartyl protease family protein
MTRPLVWAIGTVATTVIVATAVGDRIAARFGLGGPPQASLAAPASAGAQAGSRVTVSADLQGHFVVHPALDGRRVRMLVDTGASLIALSHEDAQLAGVRVAAGDYTRRIQTANGIVEAAPVRIAEVRIGDIAVRGVEALVLPPGKLATSLLGMSFLKRLGGFEIAQGRLILKG